MTSAYRAYITRLRKMPAGPPGHLLYDWLEDPPGDWARRVPYPWHGGLFHLVMGRRTKEPGKGEWQFECRKIKAAGGSWEFRDRPPQDGETPKACLHCLGKWQQKEQEAMPAPRSGRVTKYPPVADPADPDVDDKMLEIFWREAKARCGESAIPDPDAVWAQLKVVLKDVGYSLWLTR